MLAKLTSKNQITIPKKIIDQIPEARYFEVELRDGAVVWKFAPTLPLSSKIHPTTCSCIARLR
jgi:hypothetical protein